MKGVIDRFEGSFAVVVMDDGAIKNIHRDKLPEGAKEGDVLILGDRVEIDVEETKKRKKEADKYLHLWED
ncbi:DUF3006 domain-containing protein [Fonticella tunisiensis]|uniref:DUF3006 family protein n=1 Tax=Fonticella tunisiensis TaxID=1096341 RepID=A0A4R7KT33_9CLOT|nr:DUF3006 domain-containing protein [Fonticella tunisiensis]TDT62371.1 DUF3006 family protein [Fonticella tunisiensis]